MHYIEIVNRLCYNNLSSINKNLSNSLHRTKASLYTREPWALPRQLEKLEFDEEVSFLKREDAFYHKLMLMTGLDDGYDEWLNYYLESENPLSNIVLELACCGSDINKTISVLHNFCMEQPFDEAVVCDRLRAYFQDAYYTNRMSKEEISSTMYRLSLNVGDPGDFDMGIWGSLYYLDYYYSLASDRIISWESFDLAFFDYLEQGIPVDADRIWNHNR